MSTVGYGDITLKTMIGRIFLLFFIVGGLVSDKDFSLFLLVYSKIV
jgi:hypothetical protein